MSCHNCGFPLADRSKFCLECGIPVQAQQPRVLRVGGLAGQVVADRSSTVERAAVDAVLNSDRPVRLAILAAIGVVALIIIIVVAVVLNSGESKPAPIVKGPDYNDAPNQSVANKSAEATGPVVATPGLTSPTTAHQQRLAALREKQEAAEMAIEIEREAIQETVRRDGIEGVPEDEHEHVQRLIQAKEAIDAAIREEERQGGSESAPSAPSVVQTLAHHQIGQTFSVGYWTYRCDAVRWSELLGDGSSNLGRPDASFAVIHLMMRNEDDDSSIIPPLRLVDSNGREYEPSPKAVLQRDALDLSARLGSKASADGSVIFDVPQGRTYLLKVSGGMMSNELALIDLATLR